jgi:hypothetical protein
MAEELLLTGRRVVPDKALRNGFVFRHANLRAALTAILGGASESDNAVRRIPHLPAPAAKK